MSDERPETNTNNKNTTNNVSGQARLIEHVKANKVDVALWATRVLTIIFAIGYVIPIFGTSQSNFNKVLLANAATSALRLHQRIPTFAFNREFLNHLMVEDSCHYLMFSVIFFYVTPFLPCICPIVLFAILHASSYSLKLLDILGQNSWWGARFFISIVEFQTSNILRLAAFFEILLMPLCIYLLLMGRAGLMTPFVYYHFLCMRYGSRRNPYTRNMFSELRIATESLAYRSPPMISKILRGGVALVSRLSPARQAQPPPPPPQGN